MEILSNPPTRKLHYWDFLFTTGFGMSLTLDPSLGDTIEQNDEVIRIHVASRPNIVADKEMLPEEDVTIYVDNLLTTKHTVHEFTPNVDVEVEWRKTLHEIGKTIQ